MNSSSPSTSSNNITYTYTAKCTTNTTSSTSTTHHTGGPQGKGKFETTKYVDENMKEWVWKSGRR